jgi:hypothetical protein
MQLQKVNKSVVKDNLELRNTRNGTRVITKTLVDFAAVKDYVEGHNLPHFTLYPKYLKPIHAVIRHLPVNTPSEDTSDGLIGLDFDVTSIKEMLSTRRTPPEETPTKNLPLLLITFSRKVKS